MVQLELRIRQSRAKRRWVRPRLGQWFDRAWCAIAGHQWGRWRVETEDWFVYVESPRSGAWRACRHGHCGTIESVLDLKAVNVV